MARLGNSLSDNVSVGISAVTKDEFEKVRGQVTYICGSSGVDSYMFIAIRAITVDGCSEVHVGNSTAANTVIDLQKCNSTGDAEVGSTGAINLMSTGFDMTSTSGVVQVSTLTTTAADLILAAGDRLALNYGGELTSVTDTCVTVSYYQTA